jgi:alkylhydroperoxidase/carboxymuconolactone decarboxylase family protein YurZ
MIEPLWSDERSVAFVTAPSATYRQRSSRRLTIAIGTPRRQRDSYPPSLQETRATHSDVNNNVMGSQPIPNFGNGVAPVERVKKRFLGHFGYWSDDMDEYVSARASPLSGYLDLMDLITNSGALTDKDRELLFLGTYANPTFRHQPGIERHARRAREAGATQEEIIQTVMIVGGVADHSATVGLPIAAQIFTVPDTLTARQQEVKDFFVEYRGLWSEHREATIRVDADLFELQTQHLKATRDGYSPQLRELLYLAADASITHLFVRGITTHIHEALRVGNSQAAIIDAFRISDAAGMHASIDCACHAIAAIKGTTPMQSRLSTE